MDVNTSWNEWKKTLARAVNTGQRVGMSQQKIENRAAQIGDFLAKQVDPANPQQAVLKELWQVADEQEQQAIAGALVKLVGKEDVGTLS